MQHLNGTDNAGIDLLGYYNTQMFGTGLVILVGGLLGGGLLGGRLLGGGLLGGGLLGGGILVGGILGGCWSLADIFLDHNLHWLFTGT